MDEFEGQGHRSKVKVTKVKKCKILIFSLVSENEVKGQGHGVKVKGHEVKVKCLIFNLVSEMRSKVKIRGEGHEVKVTEANLSGVITR